MEKSNDVKPELILFDVYETLLDMSETQRRVNALMDSRLGYAVWFEMFMQYCFVDNCTIQFNSFDSIGKATLQMASHFFHRELDEHDMRQALETLKHLPLHEHVQDGLSGLHEKGYRIAALTNSPERIVLDRMERTGLVSYFEEVLSAEHVRKYKPCIEVYQWASRKLSVPSDKVLLVSSHGWDIAGAANAGMKTAYLKQDRQILYPLAPKPDLICNHLEALRERL